ncbi:MAG: hypothetical protein ACK44P_08195 [Bacteroidota bacterium]|jgi:hypothetical protein|nr:hypothetical protein [Sphingobacteriales bacterium]
MSNSKHHIFLFLFLCLNVHGRAQIIEWSNQQKVKSKTYYSQVLGQNSAGIFLLRSRSNDFSKELTIERYKPNLTLEITRDLPVNSGVYLEKMMLKESGLIMFASKKNYEQDKIEIIYYLLDDNFNPTGSGVLLQVSSGLFKEEPEFYVRVSADRKFFSIAFISLNGTDKYTSLINAYGFNDQLVQTYKKEYLLSYDVDDIYISAVETDNLGSTHMLIDYPKNVIRRSKEKELRAFFLYSFLPSEQKPLTQEIVKDSLYIYDLALAVNNYHKSICVAGFYSKEKEGNKISGHFQYVLNMQTAKLSTVTFEDFDKYFIAKVAGSMQNENAANITDLHIKRIIPRSDGGCLIVGEKYYESRQMYTYFVNGIPQTQSRMVFNYDEVIFISKNADGTTQFRDFIKKKQSSVGDAGYYSSFVLLNANERISFIYNSDTGEESDVMITTLNPKGEMNTRILIKALSYYVSIMPPESKQVSSNTVIISTLKDKRFSLLRITN